MIETPLADVLREYLFTEGECSYPNTGSVWPCFTTSLPDGDNAVDDAIAIFDDDPEKDGRHMDDGSVVLHYGLLTVVRSAFYADGWAKLNQITRLYDATVRENVTISSAEQFTILNLTRRAGVSAYGLEAGTKRRFLFDAQYVMTITQV